MMKQVVILAGGKGSRMRERLGDRPKPLLDVCGVTLLERQVMLAKQYGFVRVLILVNYKAQTIVEFCRNKGNWGLNIECIDDGEPRGTAGAVLNALDHLEDEFLLMYGDTILNVDLDRFYQFHSSKLNSAATLFLHPNDHPHDSDLVEIDSEGIILGFYPYPHDPSRYYPNLVNAALYWIRKSSLEPWRGYSGGVLDFGKQLFPAIIERGGELRGYNSPEYIKDCGTPNRIDQASMDLESGKIERSSLRREQPAVFIDRDGTINREVMHLNSPDQLELLPGTEGAIRRLNHSGFRVCVVTNQPVIARGECTDFAMRQIHNKLESRLGRNGAFVDRIYYCPHYPESGFNGEVRSLKIPCDCRKPNTGMIEKAISELNVSKRDSWMIGDTTTDLQTARNAQLKSILVETGYSGLDEKYWAVPDFVVPDLAAAVTLILEIYPLLVQMVDPIISGINPGDVVFIGGQSRSGKSSFGSVMRHLFFAKGRSCHVISTDRWLLSEKDRAVDAGVLQRHATDDLGQIIQTLTGSRSGGLEVDLPGYSKSRRLSVPNVDRLTILPTDILIVEGVVSLHYAKSIPDCHKFFVEIDEEIRRQRVIHEYIIRGLSLESAKALYLQRSKEEVPWINATGGDAYRVSIPGTEALAGKHDYQ